MKLLLAINICFVFAALIGTALVGCSYYATTAKYAEFERRGCVNESSLIEFGKERFRPGYRQDVALWIAGPSYGAAKTNAAIALAISVSNIFITCVLLLKRKPSSS